MCVRQVSRKINIFVAYVKKREKTYLVKSIIFTTEFCLFYTKSIFYETTL
jgi:hypothetical protein